MRIRPGDESLDIEIEVAAISSQSGAAPEVQILCRESEAARHTRVRRASREKRAARLIRALGDIDAG